MNLPEIKATRTACLDAFDTLTALQNKHGFSSPEWLAIHEVKKLVLARSVECRRLIAEEEAKAV
jgi:hypothetical protein